MRAAILALLLVGCTSADARAPEATGIKYVVREMYVRDVGGVGKPFTYKDCEINRGFRKANPAPMEGYAHVFMCVPIGAR